MAQIVVDSSVMRDKAKTIKDNAETIKTSYTDMLTELRNVTSRMKSGTLDTMRERFAGMQSAFETFATDMTAYHDFLIDAAENYEKGEQEGKAKAEDLGKGF